MKAPVLETIERIWPRGGTEWRRGAASPPEQVLQQLRSEYTEEDLRVAITKLLLDVAATYDRMDAPAKRDSFLADCSLELIAVDQGVAVDARLLQHILRSYPVSIWYRPLLRVVPKLSVVQFFEGLLQGLQSGQPEVLYNSLAALQLLQKHPKDTGEPERSGAVVAALRERLAELENHSNIDISERARRVSKLFS